jgi:energy-coupling factor transporter transmembrane protein EcfT
MEFLFTMNPFFYALIVIFVTILLFRLCYFFENFSTFKISNLLAIFALLFIGVFLFFKALKETYFVIKIKENYGLTQGKITYYKSGRGRKVKGQVDYDYVVNNILISNVVEENDFVDIPDKKPDTTINYLIIYEQKRPQNSFLLFNYPVVESDDILEYQELFKKGIPDDVFVN